MHLLRCRNHGNCHFCFCRRIVILLITVSSIAISFSFSVSVSFSVFGFVLKGSQLQLHSVGLLDSIRCPMLLSVLTTSARLGWLCLSFPFVSRVRLVDSVLDASKKSFDQLATISTSKPRRHAGATAGLTAI